jgi:type I restriction enzyme S subunit
VIRTSLPWAETIPDGWRVAPLKRVCSFYTGWTPPTGDAEAYIGENLWANISDLGERVVRDTAKRLSDKAVARHGMVLSPAGSLLFSFKLSVGQVSFAGADMYTNEAIATFPPSDQLDIGFAYYAFPEMLVRNASENIYGARMLNQQLMNDAPLVIPPISQQATIAAFLDRETGKIDVLVEEQRRLIELLKEKRQAVISHAVTKGLDPNVKMKPSGVEWLGTVPAHWEVMPIRYVARLESGHTPSRSRPKWWENCTVPWFTLADIWQVRTEGRSVITETSELVSEVGLVNSSARVLPKGTVMLSRTASVGFAAIMGVDMATSQDFANWVCGPRLHNEFLLWTFRAMRPEFSRMMMGSTHNTIYMPDIAAFRFGLPPLQIQEAIASHLAKQAKEIDALIGEATKSEALLLERRSALISAAVTGKIDVRQEAQADVEAA